MEENLHALCAQSNGRIVKRKDLHKESFRTHNNFELPGKLRRTLVNCLRTCNAENKRGTRRNQSLVD